MAQSIYDQHEKSFPLVSAYVVVKDGQRVATIAFKFPRNGAGRMYCYLHVIGIPMVRGFANGYGYDKKSAACESAAESVDPKGGYHEAEVVALAIKAALAHNNGHDWDCHIRDAGFDVWQAV